MKKIDISKITKEQYDVAYNKHLPNKWIILAYKYFSDETERKNLILSNTLIFILYAMFFIGFFGTIFHLSKILIGIPTIIYTLILSSLVFFLFGAILLNNYRIGKICKDLGGISKEDYNILTDKFF